MYGCRSSLVRGGAPPVVPPTAPFYPAAIPRTPAFAAVRRHVDNSLTCCDSSPESAKVRHKHVRNVEVGGSSPLTSTRTVLSGARRAGSWPKTACPGSWAGPSGGQGWGEWTEVDSSVRLGSVTGES